jgi:hypothetical protein
VAQAAAGRPADRAGVREGTRMKGIVFNLLEELVRERYGEDTWDDILEDTRVPGAYTSLGSYPDEDMLTLVGATSRRCGLDADEVVRMLGRSAIPKMAEAYPVFFVDHKTVRSFLLTLNDIIHPEVRKIYPGADVPDFQYHSASATHLEMVYASHRKLCSFAEGMMHGSADYYGETIHITQPECMLRGDARCLLHITFGG